MVMPTGLAHGVRSGMLRKRPSASGCPGVACVPILMQPLRERPRRRGRARRRRLYALLAGSAPTGAQARHVCEQGVAQGVQAGKRPHAGRSAPRRSSAQFELVQSLFGRACSLQTSHLSHARKGTASLCTGPAYHICPRDCASHAPLCLRHAGLGCVTSTHSAFTCIAHCHLRQSAPRSLRKSWWPPTCGPGRRACTRGSCGKPCASRSGSNITTTILSS